jgi:peptide chain release factor subunit 1
MVDRMATATNLDVLRALAGFRAAKGCAISLYLDLDPQNTINPGDVQTRVNSLLDVGGRHAGFDSETLSREQKNALKEDVDRIKGYFASDFDRSGMRAFALFSSSLDNLWKELPLPCPVNDDVRLGRELYLSPLLTVIGRGEGALVAVVSRERGEVYRLRGGRLHEIANETEDVPNQHDQGGWSQARYQRHVDEVVQRHLRHVGEAIDKLIRREPSTQLVIIANEETRSDVEAVLSPESRNAICGWASVEAHATGQELLEAAMPVLEQARAEQERQALDRWREEAARDGRAAAGWERTLEAASDGRVELLLVQERANREAYECPQCGRGSITNGNCPLDGTRMEKRPDGLDLAVHRTLEHGGAVWLAQHSEDLAPVEGIGALLRY